MCKRKLFHGQQYSINYLHELKFCFRKLTATRLIIELAADAIYGKWFCTIYLSSPTINDDTKSRNSKV